METTRLQKAIAAALTRRRGFVLTEAAADEVRARLSAEGAPASRRVTIWLDRPDAGLAAAALLRPWACLQLSFSADLQSGTPRNWEVRAARHRGPTCTAARFAAGPELLPRLCRDGAAGEEPRAVRAFARLRGSSPLLPSLMVIADRMAVKAANTSIALESDRTLHHAPPDLVERIARGAFALPPVAARLPGAHLELDGKSTPGWLEGLIETASPAAASAFAHACAHAYPAGVEPCD